MCGGGDDRHPAGHRLDEREPERLAGLGQDEQIRGVQRLGEPCMLAPAGEEGLLVSERAGDRERVLAFPLAGVAAKEDERRRPAERFERTCVSADQER
jgi:hypothetical protein